MAKILTYALLTCLTLTSTVHAAVVYDEATDGDLSSNNLSPTVLTFTAGENVVAGIMGRSNGVVDRDFFSFTLQPGLSLTSLSLDKFVSTEDVSFLAIEAGPALTNMTNPAADLSLLGSALIGTGAGKSTSEDVLDDLGLALTAGQGFSPPLAAGTYTMWFQETATSVQYELNFHVSQVPLPPTAWTFVAGLCGIFLTRLKLRK